MIDNSRAQVSRLEVAPSMPLYEDQFCTLFNTQSLQVSLKREVSIINMAQTNCFNIQSNMLSFKWHSFPFQKILTFQYLCVNGRGLLMRWNIYKSVAFWGLITCISYCMIIHKVHIEEGRLYRNQMNLTIRGCGDPSSDNLQIWCLLKWTQIIAIN